MNEPKLEGNGTSSNLFFPKFFILGFVPYYLNNIIDILYFVYSLSKYCNFY